MLRFADAPARSEWALSGTTSENSPQLTRGVLIAQVDR
jgi:hypothetical protein